MPLPVTPDFLQPWIRLLPTVYADQHTPLAFVLRTHSDLAGQPSSGTLPLPPLLCVLAHAAPLLPHNTPSSLQWSLLCPALGRYQNAAPVGALC